MVELLRRLPEVCYSLLVLPLLLSSLIELQDLDLLDFRSSLSLHWLLFGLSCRPAPAVRSRIKPKLLLPGHHKARHLRSSCGLGTSDDAATPFTLPYDSRRSISVVLSQRAHRVLPAI